MDKLRTDQIINALKMKGVNKPCPRCSSTHFSVLAESAIQIQNEMGTYVVGGPIVPVAVIACNNCGYLTQHALGSLEISPEVAHAG
jgi:uncharacterized Zn finger protein